MFDSFYSTMMFFGAFLCAKMCSPLPVIPRYFNFFNDLVIFYLYGMFFAFLWC